MRPQLSSDSALRFFVHDAKHWQSHEWRRKPHCRIFILVLLSLARLRRAGPGCEFKLPGASELRVAVCVVGQLGRLEVDSKIKNLLVPNKDLIGALDVFLVLEDGEARYTNAKTRPCIAAPDSVEVAREVFASYTRVFYVKQEHQNFDFIKPERWESYAGDTEQRTVRINNHVNQYISWKMCFQRIIEQEILERQKYHSVLRLRDNSLVVKPYVLHEAFLRSLRIGRHLRYNSELKRMVRATPKCASHPPRAVTKACASYGGYADKAMLIPRMYLEDALAGPAEDFLAIQEENPQEQLLGPEQYLLAAMNRRGVPVMQEALPGLLPITDGRCETGKYFCLVHDNKDCRPPNTTGWLTCLFSYTRGNSQAELHTMMMLGIVN